MDSRNHSLADFFDVDADMAGRAKMFGEYLKDIREKRHLQYRRISMDGSGPVMKVVDHYTGKIKEMVYLASNDYLNLTKHPRTIAAGRKALEKYGSGAGSVPLLGGTLDIHIELEKKIAKFKGCEDSIIYTSGFGSNCGSLLSILQEKDIAILDTYVHASIIDGCKSTNIRFFRHNDMNSLERVLQRVKDKYRTKLIAVDGVYSMDGDIASLDRIAELAKTHGAYVMVDEAHATGVIGDTGRGTPQHHKIEGKVDIVAGTLSKALGGVGGFIAANSELVELLRYYSRPYIFSTAMTPQVAGSLLAAIDVIEEEPEHRERLWENIRYFRSNLTALGFDLGNSETAIFPIIIGNDLKVKEICRRLHELDIYANPVMYPAVPKRLSRIRMSLMSAHTKEHLDKALDALETAGREYGVI
ncbi:MAG TPA: aminotransferase class I/II-fold pyridoxal phosphate-dependent enzyme [Bacillota bacterium]|nr:aminotransferase class I/II-fold pyridoxal phosphate-dependent enzyme [Bacillota bacterium]HQA66141.1 aminotransferase class I/II-fold pyridoxal phosphate-dependent enzyme [Bacillota bacterium]HQO42969.1 aminotransferase class I/II-fold pyridoxal phosphate-dependent enzyme [Bacillota bacterium]HQQ43603.1 aminotransferase class I/II-fold pyridoxal phosphate-dependent enzyme [Bacillota bacterium]